ncbi:beta-ketoacyl synthase chain length factor, partial [Desulfosarcina cetonica]|uniref:beta-ketoacyl synthase chain length factor n=1 Tax=Desulfosarcina cetonica TaxID=90730 RepID=UPI00155DC484
MAPSRQPGHRLGRLSETHDFLSRLQTSDYQFPSPMDFIGSVHNAPAGQVAMLFAAKGANLTVSGGDYSFEEALLAADGVTRTSADPILVMGADEAHPQLSPLFDPSVSAEAALSDGGGAILLRRDDSSAGICLAVADY